MSRSTNIMPALISSAEPSPEEEALLSRIEAVARDALADCRTSLMMAYRFLDVALWKMPFEHDPLLPHALSTDGTNLYFDGRACVRAYRDAPNDLARCMLHAILHCIFRQPYDDTHEDTDAWCLACDVAIEAVGVEIGSLRFPCARDDERREAAGKLKKILGTLNPPVLYRYFAQALSDPYSRMLAEKDLGMSLRDLAFLFMRDDHSFWHFSHNDEQGSSNGSSDSSMTGEQSPDDENGVDDGDTPPSDEQNESETENDDQRDQDHEDDREDFSQEESEWESIGKQVEGSLDSFAEHWGDIVETFLALLTVTNRKQIDYSEFLRRFATMGEDMRINDDEFDYIFYMYGLERYGNMPLIEPLEYKETHRVREFVIAIDTSGSCEGELVRGFVKRTYDLLHATEEFGSKVLIHIIQCDATIQNDTVITSMDELADYVDDLQLLGFGGTDFNPVFDYVNDLLEQGQFEDLRGLIYFTDGIGKYPDTKPPYDTAFVFLDDTMGTRRVPPWAMKVVMDTEGIRNL